MRIIFKILSGSNNNNNNSPENTSTSIPVHNSTENGDENYYSIYNSKNLNQNIMAEMTTYNDNNIEPMEVVTNCDSIDGINAKINNNNNNSNINNNHNAKEIINLEIIDTDKLMKSPGEYCNNNANSMDIVPQEYNLDQSNLQNRMRLALGVLIRLVLPLCNGVARGWKGIRGVRLLNILRNLGGSRHMLTNMLAYAVNTVSLSLSSVQVVYRIDPLLKIIKLRKNPDTITRSITSPNQENKYHIPSNVITSPTKPITSTTTSDLLDEPEKCVTINVLAEPPPGIPIRADIIFVHGLHGSLVNTWKQGLWNSEGKKEDFERPPKPPLRPPKRPRHSRSSIFVPPQLKKRARYAASENDSIYDSYDDTDSSDQENSMAIRKFIYDYDEPESSDFCDDIEYNFPTFRLCREDSSSYDENDKSTMKSIKNLSNSTSLSQISASLGINDSNENFEENSKKSSTTTSTNSSTTSSYSKCWPGDWLPLDCPGVRVIALNYTTDPYLWRPVWVRKRNRSSLAERAREMTDMLIEKRVGYGHPIVWVGHSKGGIFIKQIIVDAWESGRPTAAPLWRSSRGVFFYSVPHRGSQLADFNLPLLRQSIELLEIQKNSPSILDLHRRFVALYQSGNLKIDVFSFVETALTLMSVLYLRIVGVDSADPGIGEVCGVHLDHRQICKPRNRNCKLYTELVKMINRVS